jgi:hypothetical protein
MISEVLFIVHASAFQKLIPVLSAEIEIKRGAGQAKEREALIPILARAGFVDWKLKNKAAKWPANFWTR